MPVKPEDVGLSSLRLARIGDHMKRYIDAGKIAGTLTLVARRGQVAYLEPQGHLEIERRRPVTADAVWRIYSMTKPITSVGLMMLYEEGSFQLDDPVLRFIPTFSFFTRSYVYYLPDVPDYSRQSWKTGTVSRALTSAGSARTTTDTRNHGLCFRPATTFAPAARARETSSSRRNAEATETGPS